MGMNSNNDYDGQSVEYFASERAAAAARISINF